MSQLVSFFRVFSFAELVHGGTPTSLVVPPMSYSSSEGEEDFYDANDSPIHTWKPATDTHVSQPRLGFKCKSGFTKNSELIGAHDGSR
jgi:hypothetical protein